MLGFGFAGGVGGGVTQELADGHAKDARTERLQHATPGELVIVAGHNIWELGVRSQESGEEAEFVAIEEGPAEVGHTWGFSINDDSSVGFFFRAG